MSFTPQQPPQAYAAQQPPSFDQQATPPRRPRRTALWVSLAVVGVILVGGGIAATVFFLGARDDAIPEATQELIDEQDDAEAELQAQRESAIEVLDGVIGDTETLTGTYEDHLRDDSVDAEIEVVVGEVDRYWDLVTLVQEDSMQQLPDLVEVDDYSELSERERGALDAELESSIEQREAHTEAIVSARSDLETAWDATSIDTDANAKADDDTNAEAPSERDNAGWQIGDGCADGYVLPSTVDPRVCGDVPAGAITLNSGSYITTPSGNTNCRVLSNRIECAMGTPDIEIVLNAQGKPRVDMDEIAPYGDSTLAEYDNAYVSGSMVCLSEFDGLSCWSLESGHGMQLSRENRYRW